MTLNGVHLIMHGMKIVIVLALLAIIASLGSALFFMMRGNHGDASDALQSRRMVRALALRVGLSVALLLLLLLSWKLGWIQPTGLPLQ